MAGEASPENGCSFQLSGIIWKRVSMGLTISRANVLEIKRQPSKKVFFTVNCQKERLMLTARKFQGILNLTISADIHRLLVPEESLNWKKQFPCSQKPLCLDIRRPYNLLQYMKYFEIS